MGDFDSTAPKKKGIVSAALGKDADEQLDALIEKCGWKGHVELNGTQAPILVTSSHAE